MMKKTWQAHNLEGSGLQSINLAYASRRKDTKKAYLLATLFPLGIHQFYLGQKTQGLIYVFLTLLLLVFAKVSLFVSAIIGFAQVMLLIRDIIQTEAIVAKYNKNLKMQLSLQHNTNTPEDFKGRYTDDDTIEKKTQQKILSFAEQEALLKEMSLKKKQNKKRD